MKCTMELQASIETSHCCDISSSHVCALCVLIWFLMNFSIRRTFKKEFVFCCWPSMRDYTITGHCSSSSPCCSGLSLKWISHCEHSKIIIGPTRHGGCSCCLVCWSVLSHCILFPYKLISTLVNVYGLRISRLSEIRTVMTNQNKWDVDEQYGAVSVLVFSQLLSHSW